MSEPIRNFEKEYFYLSNFYPCKIKYIINNKEIEFSSAQELYERLSINEKYKNDNILKIVLREKFLQNPDLLNKLVTTGMRTIINDKDNIGSIIMDIRYQCYQNTIFQKCLSDNGYLYDF